MNDHVTGDAAPVFVVVSGPPGSGKSTIARPLARELGLPLVAKDTIKEALMSVMEVGDVEASRAIGAASVVAMFAVAADSPRGAVIDCNLHRSRAVADLRRLPGRVIEVFCRCDREAAIARYRARAGERAAGHFDGARTPEELWSADVTEPVAAGWPVIEVDTNRPVDLGGVVASLVQATRSA